MSLHMRIHKTIVFALYTLIIVCIGLATVIEKYQGTAFVATHIYGAWWFTALWAVLTVAACAYMTAQRLYKRMAVMLLHLSFIVILAGALTTHLFAERGSIRLRTGVSEMTYADSQGTVKTLPFKLTLKAFRIVNYPGTDAPLDFQSTVGIDLNDGQGESMTISMNNVGSACGYRFFQSSYDSDSQGVTLGVSHDPWGIGITYTGYLLLLLGITATLLSRRTQMRSLYRQALTALLLTAGLHANAGTSLDHSLSAQSVVDKDLAQRMGTINVLYNNRICPLNTVTTDFVAKLTGQASWNGYTADQIFTSWMIFYSPWEHQPLIRVKSREVQQLLGIGSQWASYSDFLNEHREYKLGQAVSSVLSGAATTPSAYRKALLEADEKFQLVEMFYKGQLIRMFPYKLAAAHSSHDGPTAVSWFPPGAQTLPEAIPVKEQFFIKQAMDFLTESIVTGQHERAKEIIAKIKLFQRDMIGNLLPSELSTKAELLYNTLRSYRWPVFLALTLSLLLCILLLTAPTKKRAFTATKLFAALLAAYVTLQLALRWWLSGHIPVSNGHETMLFMAWVLLLFPIVLSIRPAAKKQSALRLSLAFCPLVASFCLLVAMLSGSGSQITPLMPVLQSPLLSVHVMTVMSAYALFALQVLLAIQGLLLIKKEKKPHATASKSAIDSSTVTALSRLMLYPAVFLLTVGIFLGAVWANV